MKKSKLKKKLRRYKSVLRQVVQPSEAAPLFRLAYLRELAHEAMNDELAKMVRAERRERKEEK